MSELLAWLAGGAIGASGRLEWTAPEWQPIAAASVALLAWASSIPGDRRPAVRVAEAALWGVALGAVVVASGRPVWIEEQGRKEPARAALLVDASRSMSVLDGGKARSTQADALVAALSGSDVDVYHFGGDLVLGAPSAYDLGSTDLEGALIALSERVGGERLSALAVITDGIDRGPMRHRWRDDSQTSVPALPGPLTVYPVGAVGELRDLAVEGLDAGGYAFVHSAFTMRARLHGEGYGGRTVTAQLSRDGSPVKEVQVRLDAAGDGVAEFEVVPDAAGRFAYAVSVPVFRDDAVPANNVAPLVVRVVRDRIRVLQVAGAPTWDVKFLRRFLKGDPSVDLVSFFILRTDPDMYAGYDDDELSLIPFPYEDLFTSQLDSFDLIVFQDFNHGPYLKGRGGGRALLDNIRKAVEEKGKGFVMVGGHRSFNLGQYGGTPIETLLPLRLGVPATRGEPLCDGQCDPLPFVPVLSDEGSRHPITRLLSDPDENGKAWGRLHPSDGTNLSLGSVPGSAVLLTHPTRTVADGSPLPILAVREVGRGRSMALTIDASWRWSFSEAAEGRGNQAYLRFWKNAFRWLVADPSTSRVEVETPRENYALGDTVRVVVTARDPGFAPLPGAKVTARVVGGGKTFDLSGETGPDGQAVLPWPAMARGALRVIAKVDEGDGRVGEAETVFAVTSRDPELDEVVPDHDFLRWFAGREGGEVREVGDTSAFRRDAEAGRTRWDRREVAVWRGPWLALLGAGAAGLAWIVRRRAGLR